MRHYATLFDSTFLPQGLALYESLKQHSVEPFMLHILAMDHGAEDTLCALKCDQIDVWGFVKLNRLEGSLAKVYRLMQSEPADWLLRSGGPPLGTQRLGAYIDESRTHAELCWTMASQFTEWMLGWLYPGDEELTYLDADLFFFGNPSPIFAQIGERSIGITPHRLPENSQKARLEQNGKYNVGFVHFKNTRAGRSCLSRWAAQVRQRCSADVGCGDQVYLDEFESHYPGEVAILDPGVNAGPWNLSAYEVNQYDGQVFLGRDPLYCYHFHELRKTPTGYRYTNYSLRDRDIDLIYTPYIAALKRAEERIASIHIRA